MVDVADDQSHGMKVDVVISHVMKVDVVDDQSHVMKVDVVDDQPRNEGRC